MANPGEWRPDPNDASLLRWWDGTQWTEHTAPAQPPAQAQQPATAAAAAAAPAVATTGASYAGLANSTLLSDDNKEKPTTGRLTRQNPAVIKVTLGAPILVQRGAMIAFQGDVTFAYEGSGAKRFMKAAFTGESVRMMRCAGSGELFVSHHEKRLHTLELGPGEQLTVSSSNLLGFDDTVTWDITSIKASGIAAAAAGGIFNVQLTGPGAVIIASDWPVVLNTSEAKTCCDPDAVVAWSSNLTVNLRTTMTAGSLIGRGSGEAFQLEFSPGGFVIVEPEAFFPNASD